jgi:hypothetical protein
MSHNLKNLSNEELQQTIDAYRKYGTQKRTAEALGLAQSAISGRLARAAQRGMFLNTPAAMPGYEIKSVATKEDGAWIKQVKEAGEVFEPPAGFQPGRITVLTDAEGRETVKWQRWDKDAQGTKDLIDAIKAEFSEYKGCAKLIPEPEETYAELCQYYPIVDPHVGMLAWESETGESNDLRIGLQRIQGGLRELIGRAPPAETAVIINTGDFFHADDQRNATPASGHQLDVDGRNQKVKRAGVSFFRTMIDLALQKHKTVIVKNLKGNHDPESAMWLNIALGLFYSNNPRVVINLDDGNNDHFFHLFGVNYTAATHGHTMKPDRMYVMMAEDNPEYWNASLYRWCIFGHIHHETKKTIGSVVCESFTQPVPKDSFAHAHGYRSPSAMQSITLHRDGGEVGRHRVNFAPSRGLKVPA